MFNSFTKTIIFSLATMYLLGSCNPPSVQKANQHYKMKEYAVAEDMYAKVYKNSKTSKKDKLTSAINAAEAYYYNHDYKNALKWFSTAIQKGAKDPMFH